MTFSSVRRLSAFLACVFLYHALAAQSVQTPSLTVHAIWGSGEFASDLVDFVWTSDGKAYTTVESEASGATDLYRVDAVGGGKQLLVRGRDLVPPGAAKPVGIEEYTFSADGSKLLIFTNSVRVWRQNTKGTFLVWDFAARRLISVSTRPGTANSEVKIGVVEVAGGRTSWVDLGPDKDIYVAAMGFADSSGALWLTRLNRHQNRLDLLLADPQTGASRVIMTDSDSAWVDANQPRWIDGGRQFLFMSERDGYDQVYLFDRSGSLVRRVRHGGWDGQDVYGVDEKNRVRYFSGARAGPLERQLMRVGLDGKGLKSLSTEPGTHSAAFA